MRCQSGAARTSRSFSFVVALVGCVALAGCGVTRDQLDAAGAFGKSASTLAESVKEAYAQADQSEADFRLARQTVSSQGKAKIWEDRNVRLYKLDPQHIPGRIAAAEALSAYGEALTVLLDSKSQESDFSKATMSLVGSVKGLPRSVLGDAKISADDINGIGAVVVALGNIGLEYQRRQVLEEVVPAAEPAVTKICVLFSKDFDQNRDASVAKIVSTAAGIATKDIGETFISNGQEAGDKMQNRALLLPLLERVQLRDTKMLSSFKTAKEAASECAKSSVALAKAVKDPQMTLQDIVAFAAKAQAAFDAVKKLSNKGGA